MMQQIEDILIPAEAAALLRLPERIVRAMAANGAIPHLWQGKRLRFSRAALLAWAEETARAAVAPEWKPVRLRVARGLTRQTAADGY